jgi:hypothetical protein
MITNKDSWKFLVAAFLILLITCGAGAAATTAGTAGYILGVANILLGIGTVVAAYLKFRDKD